MAAFITTMFVKSPKSPSHHPHRGSPACPSSPSSPSQLMNSFPSPPKPLDSVVTLADSTSNLHLPAHLRSDSSTDGGGGSSSEDNNWRRSVVVQQYPPPTYTSPIQKQFHAALGRGGPHHQQYHFKDLLRRGMSNAGSSNSRTARAAFRPQKAGKGTTNWQLKQFAEATLGSGSLRKAVKLPEGEDRDEWLAVNVVDFYNQINLLYGSITEFCSPQSCPEMKATDEFEYLWQDESSDLYRKPTKMPAPEYVEHLMSWVQRQIDDESVFPSRIGVPFPKNFRAKVLNIFKRLYRVFAHIYCHHYPVVCALGLEPHLNTSFKHYVLFVEEHGLAGNKDFWGPMGELVENMLRSD